MEVEERGEREKLFRIFVGIFVISLQIFLLFFLSFIFPPSFSFIPCFLKLTGFWYKHVPLNDSKRGLLLLTTVRISSFPNEIGHGKVSLRNWPELKTWKLPIFSTCPPCPLFFLWINRQYIYIYIYIYTIGIKCQSHWQTNIFEFFINGITGFNRLFTVTFHWHELNATKYVRRNVR